MTLESATNVLRSRVGEDTELGGTLKFDFGSEGVVFIDGRSRPTTFSNDNKDADCTIGLALSELEAMFAADLSPTVAFMSGKLRVEGDVSVATRLPSLQ